MKKKKGVYTMKEKILKAICNYYGNDEFVEETYEELEDLATYIANALADET